MATPRVAEQDSVANSIAMATDVPEGPAPPQPAAPPAPKANKHLLG
jgi:hypothetical protein